VYKSLLDGVAFILDIYQLHFRYLPRTSQISFVALFTKKLSMVW